MDAKEKWMEDTLAAFDGVRQAEANPYLFEKIRLRQAAKSANLIPVGSRRIVIAIAGLALLLTVNIASWKYVSAHTDSVQADQAFSTEYFGFLNSPEL